MARKSASMNTAARQVRQDKVAREQRYRARLIATMGVLSLIGIVLCGYGYAAVSTDLLISGDAVVSAKPAGFDVQYMQDLTPQECASKVNDTTSQLIDKRDGKKYWVAKIGSQCIMTQNLDYVFTPDVDGLIELTSELSDINYSATALYEEEEKNGEIIYKWNGNSKYPPYETFTYRRTMGTSANTTYSRRDGDYVIKESAATCNGKNTLGDCPNSAFNVGEVWETDESGQEIKVRDAFAPTLNYQNTGESYDEDSMEYDAHFLTGTYYQFMAASAGSFVTGINKVAPSSICPRGWRLPDVYSGMRNNEIQWLLDEYSPDGTTALQIVRFPLYSIGSGSYNNIGQVSSVGPSGKFWGRVNVAANYAGAYNVSVSTSYISGAQQAGYFATPVRCILRAAEE